MLRRYCNGGVAKEVSIGIKVWVIDVNKSPAWWQKRQEHIEVEMIADDGDFWGSIRISGG